MTENQVFILMLGLCFNAALFYYLGYKAGYWTRKQEEIR